MGIFGNLLSATVKTVLLPIAVTVDVVDIVRGETPTTTEGTVASIGDDISDAIGL